MTEDPILPIRQPEQSPPEPLVPPLAAPLAEGRWLWRRIYVFLASFGLWLLLAAILRAAPPEALVPLSRGVMGLQALLLILYLVAPTAQQTIELLAGLRLRLRVEEGGRP